MLSPFFCKSQRTMQILGGETQIWSDQVWCKRLTLVVSSFKTWMSHSLSTVKSAMEKSWKSWWHRPPPRPLWEARKHCTVASDDKVLTLFPGSARWWFFTCQPAILSWDSGTLTPNPGRSRDPECWLSACLNEPQTCRAFRRKSWRSYADDKTGDHDNDNDKNNNNWLF